MIQTIDVKKNKNIDKFNAIAKKAHDHPNTHGLLVKIYADWCGHCRNMKADWKRLTHELKTNYQCKKPGCVLTIANIRAENLEENDPVIKNLEYIPKDVHGVPLIMYVSKGARGLEYSKERTYEEMLKWVINHEEFGLERKYHHHHHTSSEKHRVNNHKTLKGITKKARSKFRKFHRNTLKHFHKQMNQQNQTKNINNNTQGYLPAYLR
jgi:thiol-disulfide isomerase/thioredoxin